MPRKKKSQKTSQAQVDATPADVLKPRGKRMTAGKYHIIPDSGSPRRFEGELVEATDDYIIFKRVKPK